MTMRTKRTAMAVAGAVGLASGAYALGSQAGDGAAVAKDSTRATARAAFLHGGPRSGLGLDTLASRLGVEPSELRTALEDIRADLPRPQDHHEELAAALADVLGLPAAKVAAALEKLHAAHAGRRGGPPAEFVNSLAKALGLDAAKVRSALETLRGDPRGRGRHHGGPPRLDDLARALGVDEVKLRAALEKLPPARPTRRDRRGGPRVRELADALGVDAATLRAAFEKLRARMEFEHAARRDAFAAALAQRLKLPVSRVKEVLASLPHPGPPGPPGP
jgi:transcriptional regulator with XRE-family HTH domain